MRSRALAAVAVVLALGGCLGRNPPAAEIGERVVPRGAGGGASPSPPIATSPTSVPAVADDTAPALAAWLTAVESAIRAPATPDGDLDRLGQEQQRAYRTLLLHPDWHDEVVGLMPPTLRPAVAANIAAGAELARLNPPPKPEPPKWRIVLPAPAGELLAHYRAAERAEGIPWQYLAAIHLVETRMGRIRGESVAGAKGPMQFLPSTWAVYGGGGDIDSDADAIRAAARLLRAHHAPADMAAALYAYNPSDHYVKAITAYATVMQADERTFFAYHGWQVYYGDRLLPEGFVG